MSKIADDTQELVIEDVTFEEARTKSENDEGLGQKQEVMWALAYPDP